MNHVALPSRSVNDPSRPYTTTGLGDRVHSATIAWCYGAPVTIHLTADKMVGGEFGDKPDSWAQICGLFPAGMVQTLAHPVSPTNEREWLAYLKHRGFDAVMLRYDDYPGAHEPDGPDISRKLRDIPLLEAEPQDIDLPDRFITAQWDAGGPSRRLSEAQRRHVLSQYDLPIVTVGGEAKDLRLSRSLKHAAYAIARAERHIGVDSAFFHLALLYKPLDRIDLYAPGSKSHHVKRAIDNGARINRYL